MAELLLGKLRKQLEGHSLQPGDFALSESDLARSEKVNRRFVRQAVDILIREGKLERRPGKGVYVAGAGDDMTEAHITPRLVQVVVPDLTLALRVEMVRGAKMAGLKAGVRTQIYDAHGSLEADLKMLRDLPACAARGAIIIWSSAIKRCAEALHELNTARYPFVLVDETLHDVEVPNVVVDNYHGGYQVGQELISRGHHRIGCIYIDTDTVHARQEGLRNAIADADLRFDRSLFEEMHVEGAEDWSDEINRAVKKILDRPDHPTAIFFCNDTTAAKGYQVIRTLGLRIPQDISVVGFDGEPLCQLLTPTLATIRQPAREIGAAAMQMLLELMTEKSSTGIYPGERRAPGEKIITRSVSDGITRIAGHAPSTAAHKAQDDGDSLHRILPVTWQEGGSIGPAPGTLNQEYEDAKEEMMLTAAR